MGSWEFFPRCFTAPCSTMGEGVSLPQGDGFGKNMAVLPLPDLPAGAGDSEAPFWPGTASRTHTDELTLWEALTTAAQATCSSMAQHCPTHRDMPGPAVT